nr:synaptonemal complex protein 3-like isoform X1 [Camelus dromedarius]
MSAGAGWVVCGAQAPALRPAAEEGLAVTTCFVRSWSSRRHAGTHTLMCAEDPCRASLVDPVPVSLSLCSQGAGELSLPGKRHLGMAPAERKRLGRAAKAPMEAQGMAACDFGRQERREPRGPEGVPEGNNRVTDNYGGINPSPGTLEEDLRNEVREMLEGFQDDIKRALLAKRKMFEMNMKASISTTNAKIGHVWKTQLEQRQNLHLQYSRQLRTLFREWDIDVQKAQEQEEKLANMFREQRKILRQARIVQYQRLKKMKNLYEQFLKSMEELEKDHEHLLTDEQSEVRQEMAKLQNKIMLEAQHLDLAVVETYLQTLLL